MPLAFIFILSAICLSVVGAHFLVYSALVYFWHLPPTVTAKWITFVLSVSFIGLSLLTNLFYSKILSYFYSLSAFLLGTLYWLFLASILAFIIFFILSKFGLSTPGMMIGKILLLTAVGISFYGLFHSYNTQVVQYTVVLPNLPQAWENKKIVMVSDTHFGNMRNVRFARKIAQLINQQQPDAVLIPGDFVDGPPTNSKKIVEAFTQIQAPKGIYFANGNHETYHEQSQLYQSFAEKKVNVLNDSMMDVDGLQIIGADYPTTTTEKNQAQMLAKLKIDPNKPAILIKHVPNGLTSALEAGIDLQVSGHSHNGQVWPGRWLTNKVYGLYSYGQQKFETMAVITTSGAGTWGPPQRVGTNGEIVVITLSRAKF